MAIKSGTTRLSLINEDLSEIRKNKDDVSLSLRRYRNEHPNPFRDGSIYCNYEIKHRR